MKIASAFSSLHASHADTPRDAGAEPPADTAFTLFSADCR